MLTIQENILLEYKIIYGVVGEWEVRTPNSLTTWERDLNKDVKETTGESRIQVQDGGGMKEGFLGSGNTQHVQS